MRRLVPLMFRVCHDLVVAPNRSLQSETSESILPVLEQGGRFGDGPALSQRATTKLCIPASEQQAPMLFRQAHVGKFPECVSDPRPELRNPLTDIIREA